MQRHNAGADDVSTNDYDTFVEKSVKHTKSPESIESGSITDQNITDTDEVKDLGNYVFFIFMMFGFGALLPWNMFLNISFDVTSPHQISGHQFNFSVLHNVQTSFG